MLDKLPRTNRGANREGVCDQYVTIGAHPYRCKKGISYTDVKEKLQRDYNVVVNMVRTGEHCAQFVLPKGVYESLKITKQFFKWGCLRKKVKNKFQAKETDLWSSIATSFNYTSSCHTDKDFFLSMLTVTTTEGTVNGRYTYEQPIAVYFVFPELGIAVGLRPGDQLLFNPLYYHSVSTKNFAIYNNPVFVTSFYLKTAIVGQNDNDKAIEPELYQIN